MIRKIYLTVCQYLNNSKKIFRSAMMFKRICMFVGGLFIMSFGVAFSIVSTLGTTPISSIAYALALITNLSVGTTTFIFNAALILIQFIILRSRFHKKRILQLISTFVFSYFIDLALYIVSFVPFDGSVLMMALFLAISIFLLALGIFIYMPTSIAPLPGEGCVEAIAIVTNWRFSTVKIAFDTTVVITALIMCGLWYTDVFGAVYIGTIVSAFMVGFTLRQITNAYVHITGNEANLVNE